MSHEFPLPNRPRDYLRLRGEAGICSVTRTMEGGGQ